MGWSFRKSFNLGPFRLNLSKKGAGLSVGRRGLRVGHDARGRNYSQISIPGTGIYNRQYYANQKPGAVTRPAQGLKKTAPRSNQAGRYIFAFLTAGAVLWALVRFLLH
jgi:hypothetical protein